MEEILAQASLQAQAHQHQAQASQQMEGTNLSMHKQFMERADWQFYWACQELDKETKQAFMRNLELIRFEAERAKANDLCASSGRPRFLMMALVNGMSDEDVRGLLPRVA